MSEREPDDRAGRDRSGFKLSAARLAGVQALYEIEVSGAGVEPVLEEFLDRRWRELTLRDPDLEPGAPGTAKLTNPDPQYLEKLVRGVLSHRLEIDTAIAECLSGDWTLERLHALMRSVIRAAVFELAHEKGVPTGTVITEYVDLAHAFFEEKEAGFVNAVVDNLAKRLRGPEAGGSVSGEEDGR